MVMFFVFRTFTEFRHSLKLQYASVMCLFLLTCLCAAGQNEIQLDYSPSSILPVSEINTIKWAIKNTLTQTQCYGLCPNKYMSHANNYYSRHLHEFRLPHRIKDQIAYEHDGFLFLVTLTHIVHNFCISLLCMLYGWNNL